MTALAARGADIVAGVAMAGLLLPEAVAYSGIAGLPPQAGIVALLLGLSAYAAIGRSRFALVAATSSSAAVLGAALLSLSPGGAQRTALASLLVVGGGVAFLLAGSLKLGALSNLIARPVLRGYAFGLALTIVLKQWPALVGTHAHAPAFVPLLLEQLRALGKIAPYSLALGLGALLALFALEKLPRVPAALIVIVAGIVLSPWLAAHGVALVGPIRLDFALPEFALPSDAQWLELAQIALALMFVVYAESYGAIRTFALKHDETVQPNRDLIALGVANALSGLLQGLPVGAGFSATAANEAAGARSRLAGLAAGATVLLALVLLTPWIGRMPLPVLAAIVIHALAHALDWRTFRPYFRWRRDRLIALTAIAFVLAFGVLDGLLAAIAFSLAMLLRRLARPRLSELGRVGRHDFVSRTHFPQAAHEPAMLILRPEEPLFFANAEPLLNLVRQAVLAHDGIHCLVLSLEESSDLDSSTLEGLSDLAAWLAAHRIELRLARLKDEARDALVRAAIPQLPPAALDFLSVDDAASGTPAVRAAD